MELNMVFEIPYIGPINRVEKITFGHNMRHSIENSNAERFYARLFVNESKGKIVDINNFSFRLVYKQACVKTLSVRVFN